MVEETGTALVDRIVERHGNDKTQLIEALHDIQKECRYLPEEALRTLAERMGVPVIEVFRVANFYKAFTLEPRGRHLLTLCMGTACHVRGSEKLLDEVKGQLGVAPGETTSDGEITLETVNCVGACALGPVAIIDGEYHERMTFRKLRTLVASMKRSE